MNPQQIQQLVKQEVQTALHSHYHNGVDSPVLKTPQTTYIGFINGQTPPLQGYLPDKWSFKINSPSSYTIIHNLGTSNYVCLPVNSNNNLLPITTLPESDKIYNNQVTITWFDLLGSETLTSFAFAIVIGGTPKLINI